MELVYIPQMLMVYSLRGETMAKTRLETSEAHSGMEGYLRRTGGGFTPRPACRPQEINCHLVYFLFISSSGNNLSFMLKAQEV